MPQRTRVTADSGTQICPAHLNTRTRLRSMLHAAGLKSSTKLVKAPLWKGSALMGMGSPQDVGSAGSGGTLQKTNKERKKVIRSLAFEDAES